VILTIWTLAATLGALLAGWNTISAWLAYRALGDVQNGRRVLAVGWVRREVVRFFIQSVWASIGFISLATVGASAEISLIAILLVATNVAVAANTVLDARDRILLQRIIEGG
jgi:hypothetical protein